MATGHSVKRKAISEYVNIPAAILLHVQCPCGVDLQLPVHRLAYCLRCGRSYWTEGEMPSVHTHQDGDFSHSYRIDATGDMRPRSLRLVDTPVGLHPPERPAVCMHPLCRNTRMFGSAYCTEHTETWEHKSGRPQSH